MQNVSELICHDVHVKNDAFLLWSSKNTKITQKKPFKCQKLPQVSRQHVNNFLPAVLIELHQSLQLLPSELHILCPPTPKNALHSRQWLAEILHRQLLMMVVWCKQIEGKIQLLKCEREKNSWNNCRETTFEVFFVSRALCNPWLVIFERCQYCCRYLLPVSCDFST